MIEDAREKYDIVISNLPSGTDVSIDGVNYAYNKRILWLNEGDYTLKGKGEL